VSSHRVLSCLQRCRIVISDIAAPAFDGLTCRSHMPVQRNRYHPRKFNANLPLTFIVRFGELGEVGVGLSASLESEA
jgi:hypothetical protein